MKSFAIALSFAISLAALSPVTAATTDRASKTQNPSFSSQFELSRRTSAPRATCEHYRRSSPGSMITQEACRRAGLSRPAAEVAVAR